VSNKKVKNKSPFGKLLTRLRKQQGLTMSQLAKEVGVSESYISLLESGERKQPSRELVLKLAQILGARTDNTLADDFLVTAGYYPANKQTYQAHISTIAAYRQHIEAEPQDFVTYTALIFALIKMGETQEAQGLIQKGLTQFADTNQLQSLLASLELAKHNYVKAIQLQEFALAQQQLQYAPGHPETFRFELNLGVMHFLKGSHHYQAMSIAHSQSHEPAYIQEKTLAQTHFQQAQDLFKRLLAQEPNNIYVLDEYARVTFNLASLAEASEAISLWNETIIGLTRVLHAEDKYILGHATLLETAIFLAHAHSKSQAFELAETLINLLQVTVSPPHWMVYYIKACFFSLRHQAQGGDDSLDTALQALGEAFKCDPQAVSDNAPHDPDLSYLRQHQPSEFQRRISP
jgi:transcriptional regulator with XRE-family HTH domain